MDTVEHLRDLDINMRSLAYALLKMMEEDENKENDDNKHGKPQSAPKHNRYPNLHPDGISG